MAGRQLTLKNCRYVLVDKANVLENVDVLIEGDTIIEVGKGLGGGDELDCRSCVVMPGLANAHTHAAMWIFRGLFDEEELPQWLSAVKRAEEKLTPEIVELASKAAIMEMLSSGTTLFVDMYLYPEVTAKASSELGIRAAMGPVINDKVVKEGRAEKLVADFLGAAPSNVTTIINVHTAYTASEEALKTAARLSQKMGINLQFHVSETRQEVYKIKKEKGVFPVEYINKLGALTSRTLLVHMGWVTSWELSLVKEAGATVVHCPASNMKLATGGFLPLVEMLNSGINVALGTDGAASNNSLDMFGEMKTAVLLHRNSYWRTDIGASEVFEMATLGGYRALGLKGGRVAKSYLADLALLDATSPRLRPLRRSNVLSNLVYSACGCDIHATIVGGHIAYIRNEEFKEKISEIAEQLEQIDF